MTVPVRLGDVCRIQNGFAFDSANFSSSVGVPLIRIRDIAKGDCSLRFDGNYSAEYIVRRGDILIGMDGEFNAAEWSGEPALLNQRVCRLTPDTDVLDPTFLFYRIQQDLKQIEDSTPSTTVKHLSSKQIASLTWSLPPIECQRRIGVRLKAQLAEIDTARQAARAQADDIALLRRSVLRAAFDALLDRYDRDVCLKDVCSISAGGTPSRGAVAFFNGSIPWVKTLDLNFSIVTDTEEKISQQALLSIRGELLPVGTVLVAMYGGGGTIGKSGILGIEACTNQAVCAMQPKADELDSAFLHEWLCYIRPEWMRLAGGNRKDPNINKSIVESMTLPLPPLDEQRVFAKRLKLQLAEVNVIAETAAAQLSELSRLPQRLLAQAFEN